MPGEGVSVRNVVRQREKDQSRGGDQTLMKKEGLKRKGLWRHRHCRKRAWRCCALRFAGQDRNEGEGEFQQRGKKSKRRSRGQRGGHQGDHPPGAFGVSYQGFWNDGQIYDESQNQNEKKKETQSVIERCCDFGFDDVGALCDQIQNLCPSPS